MLMQTAKVMMSFQTPVELAERLRRLAAEQHRSVSAEVRLAILKHLATETPKERP
jgi:predicted DNA-binding protein